MSQYYQPIQPVQPMYGQQSYPQQVQQPQDTSPSCRQLLVQPMQFGQHYPAPTPAVQGLPQAVQQILPYLAIEIGNYLNQNAQANPVYTYYFNIVSQNQFRNGFWERVVTFGGFYTWLAIQQRMYASDQETIRNSAQFAVQALASLTAMENPQLQYFVDPALWQGCAQIAQKVASVQQQFQTLGQQAVQSPAQPMMNQVGYGQPQVQYNTQPVQPMANSWVNQTPNAPQTQATDPMGSAGVIYSTREVAPPAVPVQPVRYMPIPGAAPTVVDAVVRMPETAPAQVKGMLMAPGMGASAYEPNVPVTGTWVPIDGQYYIPAFDNNHQKLTLVSRAVKGLVGNRKFYIVENKGVSEMNQADHVIGTARSMFREANPTSAPRLHAVGADLELTAKALTVAQRHEDEAATAAYKAMGLTAMDEELEPCDSVAGLIHAAMVARLTYQEETHATFSISGSIAVKFITRDDYKALFESLGKANTFIEIVTILKDAQSRNKSSEMATLIGRIDRYLTREILHVIRKRMGLTNFGFDAFIDDIADVFTVLKKDWGDLYYEALRKYQKAFIEVMFDGGAMAFHTCGAGGDEGEGEVVFYCAVSAPPVSITLLDVDHIEFGVKINDGAAYEIYPTNFPGLFEFIEAVVSTQPLALHHFIVTDDDVVYEVHQSLIGDKLYLVSNGPTIA